ncbi:MAG: NADH-quinone oxidoreductase subunit L [Bdellovibrionales bacterium]|nr:NADH-quinone oxidoreductase subunit L [Bdellovibrionales bacterium]
MNILGSTLTGQVTENLLLVLIPLFPLVGAALLGVAVGIREDRRWQAGWAATLFAVCSFVVTVKLFLGIGDAQEAFRYTAWRWFESGQLSVALALRMDRLAGVMTLVVTGVGSLIHLYAIGYMHEDESRPRFFCYLNLFLFAMLLLVLGENLLVMFVGWEGVGLCSYLLIGFWYREMPNADAGQKAFVVNRIGDAGFLLGIFVLFWNLGTVSFPELQGLVGQLPPYLAETAALLLFVGAVGKSAQIPLFVWLPDAMAGPTPVSALIHAATMVTAGVYMVTRLGALYVLAPTALAVIAVVGTATALLAATIALAQNDIKKVLAYSTVSQLGYMFMALGAAAFSNGIYHVVTHAFFKACLFMAAGSVIVGCHHEQDMRHYGGLRKSMPLTFLAYLAATYAITGLPFGAGFFSKDAILWAVYSHEIVLFGTPINRVLWGVGLFTAFLTAFYMTRSLMMTFFGEYRGHEHPHESPWTMTTPILILAVPSLAFGFLFGEEFLHFLAAWGREDLNVGHAVLAENATYHLLEMISMGIAVAGVALAAFIYGLQPRLVDSLLRAAAVCRGVHRALLNKWWIDELYDALIVAPLRKVSAVLFSVLDRALIDGTVNGTALFMAANGEIVRRMHTGRVSSYAMVLFAGTIAAIIFWIVL